MGESSIQNYIHGTIPHVFTQGNKSLGTNIPVLVGYRAFVFSLETYFLFVCFWSFRFSVAYMNVSYYHVKKVVI